MNIKHNRFVVFTGPILCILAAMITTRTLEQVIFTLWFCFTITYDIIDLRHEKIYQYSPEQIGKIRNMLLTETIFTCFFSSVGFPSLSVIGLLFIKAMDDPSRVSFGFGMFWTIWYLLSLFLDFETVIDCKVRWYGVLLLIWAVINYAMTSEINKIGSTTIHEIKRYNTIWLFRLSDEFIINTLRWFTWCDCVFPYEPRWDIYIFGSVITIVSMVIINTRKPQKTLKFTKSIGKHMPAPTNDTALLCNKCRESQYVIDVEQGSSSFRNGFTLNEDIDSFTI